MTDALHSALGFVASSTTDQHLTGAAINFSSAGNNTVITGVTGEGIYVYKYFLVVAAATNLTFYDGATPLTGPIPLAANEAMVFTFDTRPWYETGLGNDFIINNSNAVQVSGRVYYIQVPLVYGP
jgi:hypothetical protein